MRRLLLITILGVIGIGLLLFLISIFWTGSVSGVGKLSIKSYPESLQVYINDEYIGETPLDNFTVKAGDVDVRIGDKWREKVFIAPNLESVINRRISSTGESSTGYSISYESIKTLFNQGTHLVLTSNPTGAKVYQGDTEIGTTPLVVSNLQSGKKQIMFIKDGYEPMKVDVRVQGDTILRVNGSLELDPFANLRNIALNSITTDAGKLPTLQVASRFSWGGGVISTNRYKLALNAWNKLELWGTQVDIESITDYISELDQLSQSKYEYPGLPFAYVVDDYGNVYSALGIFDYDFSKLEPVGNLRFSVGTAPVLIVSKDGDFQKPAIKDAIAKLHKYLEQEPGVSAKLVSEVAPVEVAGGETKTVELAFQNTSSLVWRKKSFYKIQLRIKSNKDSVLYDPESWISPSIISGMKEDEVLPGQIATFDMTIKAPFYSSNLTEQLALYCLTQKRLAQSGSVSLKISIKGETNKVLKIKNTPTGFLNVRSGPGLNYELLITVFPGETYAWTKYKNGWYQIIMRDGTKGWVIDDYASPL